MGRMMQILVDGVPTMRFSRGDDELELIFKDSREIAKSPSGSSRCLKVLTPRRRRPVLPKG